MEEDVVGGKGGAALMASGIGDYESAVERFLEYLLILIHMTGGQPGLETEITTLRYANAMQSIRNIFVKEGQVYGGDGSSQSDPEVLDEASGEAIGGVPGRCTAVPLIDG